MPKAKSSAEIPDSHTKYRKIVSKDSVCPLSFVLMCGYIEAAAGETARPENVLARLINTLNAISCAETLSGLNGIKGSAKLVQWVGKIQEEPGKTEDWFGFLGNDAELQKELEGILVQKCQLTANERFESRYLPVVANALQCRILLQCPYIYQKVQVQPDSKPLLETLIVITMDNEKTFRLYARDVSAPADNEEYLEKKQKLKEKIIEALIEEKSEYLGILEKIVETKDANVGLVETKKRKLQELNMIIDEFTELKEKEGKKKMAGKRSNLVDYLQQAKIENAKIIGELEAGKEKLAKIAKSVGNLDGIKEVSEPIKMCCMDCGRSESPTFELSCGHIFCQHCIICRVNDYSEGKATFAVKCILPYCYSIIAPPELEQAVGTEFYNTVFTPLFYASAARNHCLICAKDTAKTVVVHGNHAMCEDCFLAYLEHKTKCEMVVINPDTKEIKDIECPLHSCKELIKYTQYSRTLPDWKKLVEKAQRRAGIYEINEAKVGQCFECHVETNLAKLHADCDLCFCPKHASKLARELSKNKRNT